MLQFRAVTSLPIPSRHKEQFIVFLFSAAFQLAEDCPEKKWAGEMILVFSSRLFLLQVNLSCKIVFSWSTATFLPALCWAGGPLPFSLAPGGCSWGRVPLALPLLRHYLLVTSQPWLRLPYQLQVIEMCCQVFWLQQVNENFHKNGSFKEKKMLPAMATFTEIFLSFLVFLSAFLHLVSILINLFTFCQPESALLCYFVCFNGLQRMCHQLFAHYLPDIQVELFAHECFPRSVHLSHSQKCFCFENHDIK